MTSLADKIAGAPISWGVCEVPGWGYQLPPDRVLAEMQQVGLAATEFGPDGFLPADPAAMAELLAARHLTAVGGFTPVVLHEAGHDPAPGIDRPAGRLRRVRAPTCSCCPPPPARTATTPGPELDEAGWKTLLANLDRLTALAAARGVRAVLHPHVGTMVESGEEVQRVLAGIGHLAVPGHRPPADRRHRSGRADPAGPGTHRPHPLQGRRRPRSRPGSGRAS